MTIVSWEPQYVTGIPLIDNQHMELLNLTNELFRACLADAKTMRTVFKESMSRMVEYVRFHFGTEEKLLQMIDYPRIAEHKKLHENLTKSILLAAKDYNEGKQFVPNNFVRTLRDWIFGHIAIEDKIYAEYVAEQKKKGLLSDAGIDAAGRGS